jgi:hypothetical protein
MKSAVLLITAVAITSGSAHAECAGNACSSVQVVFSGGCYQVSNTGSQNVKVEFTPWGGIASSMSRVIGPGATWTPMLPFDGCMQGYIEPYKANSAANAKRGSQEMSFGPAILPKDITKPVSATTVWNTRPTQQVGLGKTVVGTKRNDAKLDKQDGCAGEWCSCVATINDPANQNIMVVRGATEAQDALRRAKQCRSDVTQVTCYSSAVLACAPYIACTAP